MIFVKPGSARCLSKIPHLISAVIEDVAFPVRVKPLLHIRVFIEVGAVIIDQSMLVRGKMGRHPIEDDANAVLVQIINEIHKILGRPYRLVGAKYPTDWYPHDP